MMNRQPSGRMVFLGERGERGLELGLDELTGEEGVTALMTDMAGGVGLGLG